MLKSSEREEVLSDKVSAKGLRGEENWKIYIRFAFLFEWPKPVVNIGFMCQLYLTIYFVSVNVIKCYG